MYKEEALLEIDSISKGGYASRLKMLIETRDLKDYEVDFVVEHLRDVCRQKRAKVLIFILNLAVAVLALIALYHLI